MKRRAILVGGGLAAALLAAASGCSTIAYYSQAITGHLELMHRARPIEAQLADIGTSEALRRRLIEAMAIRDFASRHLALPNNGSYRSYADLGRPFVVWSVFAADPLSIQLKASCFPIAGCVSYRGFYAEAAAERYADSLRAEGLDVFVSGIPAYSTLGWFDDPLLNTFIGYSRVELARLIFHELAHQVVYVKDDSMFNESFAAAVEEEGVRRWLDAVGTDADRSAHEASRKRRADFVALVLRYQQRLDELYRSDRSTVEKRSMKMQAFADMQNDYRKLREAWGGYAGYDRWFARELNNAHLASVGIYNELVPGFRSVLAAERGDLTAFYRAVRELAKLDRATRTARLTGEGVRAGRAH